MSAQHAVSTIITWLAERFPNCFSIYAGRRRPLKIGIRDDIIAAVGDAGAPDKLRAALRRYTRNEIYLSKLRASALRIDLNGQLAGAVTAEEAKIAKAWVRAMVECRAKRRAAARAPTGLPVPTAEVATPIPTGNGATPIPTAEAATVIAIAMPITTAPKRAGLADLRAAARARRGT
jgi:ProP effector